MAQILCDCGCGERFERPSFFSGACRVRKLRSVTPSLQNPSKSELVVTHKLPSNPSVTLRDGYEWSKSEEFGCVIRRKPGFQWEMKNSFSGKWQYIED
jgi:hypothetical protein